MIIIRDATPEDSTDVSRILLELGYATSPADVESRAQRLAADGAPVVVAESGGNVVGIAAYDYWFAFAEGVSVCRLSALCVSATARRGGIGEALVSEVERRARLLGCGLIELTSGRRPERTDAHAFYVARGFGDQSPHLVAYAKTLDVQDLAT